MICLTKINLNPLQKNHEIDFAMYYFSFFQFEVLCFLLNYSYVLYHHEFAICNISKLLLSFYISLEKLCLLLYDDLYNLKLQVTRLYKKAELAPNYACEHDLVQ